MSSDFSFHACLGNLQESIPHYPKAYMSRREHLNTPTNLRAIRIPRDWDKQLGQVQCHVPARIGEADSDEYSINDSQL